MTSSTSPDLAHLAIRSLQTLTAGGGRAYAFSVACPVRRGSVDLETCRACPHLARIDVDAKSGAGVVHCAPLTPAEPGCVSACGLAHDTPSVREDVSLQQLTSFFTQQGLAHVAIVDADGALVGVVAERDLLAGEVLARGHLDDVPASTVARHAFSVTEVTPLRDALRTMARHHLREIPVVSEAGRFTGWLEDLSALNALRRV